MTAPVAQIIVARPIGARVFPTLNAVNLATTFVPGDVASARITLQNQGTLTANGVVGVQLLLSTDMNASVDDVPLAAKISQLSLRLLPGAGVSMRTL